MKNGHIEYLKSLLTNVDIKGYLRHRESSTLEFKEKFGFGSIEHYAKTMAAFANNKGGYIIFGIKDSPRLLVGINRKKFNEISQEKLTGFLIEYFSPEIKWEMGIVDIGEKSFGYIFVNESLEKPVICRKAKEKLKSGEIYYRYRGQTRKIEFSELRKIIEEYRERERQYWMKLIERIAKIGPTNIALVDLLNGSIETTRISGKQLVIDKSLLNELAEKINFIEKGHFVETSGETALKVVGEIQVANKIIVPDLDPNKDYPYLQKKLAEMLGIKPYYVQVLVWKYKLKGDKRYHLKLECGKNKIHKFSKYAYEKLKSELEKLSESDLKQFSHEYEKFKRGNKLSTPG
ncbi:hypothetical protein SU69_05550 [Thermosipho melanesiensis]|uniref:ATPase AAA n=2 Tax=Thermosipho melanesiensis TaxID=46541 RepID=A0ABM6GEX7_9BACT|nr:ATP-binding protein [Thermosipho melanesiensis]ABR30948.1 putative transcriptional regulator [Thermosipho melanesiensis BI429]APT74058.1 ATPase AAA [Thermosipho melanesiensis]OOC35990.1 hypothetical protein SU68_05610 [Thermosipho melanesiensis]OOC38129.1 hypothetical protein SU69_05550 [Thermosipho melanesiensis]OOC38258.1 hypothetical protein SU70_05560 [Thermosipho melanesiensis]